MGQGDAETSKSDDEEQSDDEESFGQVRRNIGDGKVEEVVRARLEAQSDKDTGEDDESLPV